MDLSQCVVLVLFLITGSPAFFAGRNDAGKCNMITHKQTKNQTTLIKQTRQYCLGYVNSGVIVSMDSR